MERVSEQPVEIISSEDKQAIKNHIQTFNVLQVAREVFGGAEKRLYDLIDTMNPYDLLNYLLQQGWEEKNRFPEPGGTILAYGENNDVVLFLPLDKEFVDYRVQMYEALKVLIESTSVKERKPIADSSDLHDI